MYRQNDFGFHESVSQFRGEFPSQPFNPTENTGTATAGIGTTHSATTTGTAESTSTAGGSNAAGSLFGLGLLRPYLAGVQHSQNLWPTSGPMNFFGNNSTVVNLFCCQHRVNELFLKQQLFP